MPAMRRRWARVFEWCLTVNESHSGPTSRPSSSELAANSVGRGEIVLRAFEAFRPDVESPPPLTLRGGERVDSYDYPAPYDAELDAPTDEYIEQFAFHAMPFLDAKSWRHYLPRLMDHAFRRPDEPTGLVLQALIRSLRAPDREPPPGERATRLARVRTELLEHPPTQHFGREARETMRSLDMIQLAALE